MSRQDGISDLRTQVADGLTLLDAKAAAHARVLPPKPGRRTFEPIMFLVAQTIEEATDTARHAGWAGHAWCRRPGAPGDQRGTGPAPSPCSTPWKTRTPRSGPLCRSAMLKEGWDVKNIYVIASVRSMESQLLTEQILGRGLRLPFGKRTGNPMLDTVEVLSHHSFSALLKQARVLLGGDPRRPHRLRRRWSSIPLSGKHVPGVPLSTVCGISPPRSAELCPSRSRSVSRAPAGSDPNQAALFDTSETGDGVEDAHVGIDHGHRREPSVRRRRLDGHPDQGAASALTGWCEDPALLPQVVTTDGSSDPFSLSQVNLTEVEMPGRQFANDDAPTLTRKALDAHRDETGAVHASSSPTRPRPSSPPRPHCRSTRSRSTWSPGCSRPTGSRRSVTEGQRRRRRWPDPSCVVPTSRRRHPGGPSMAVWPPRGWRSGSRPGRPPAPPVRSVRSPTSAGPSHGERTETQPPADRQVIDNSRDFTRGYPYYGWTRSIYEINAFDAYSTEFRLASLFETTTNVKAWVRLDQTVPLRISYLVGAIQRQYEPDFLVIDDHDTYWIVEGKADAEMLNSVVVAKREAARAWVSTVNASGSVHDKWALPAGLGVGHRQRLDLVRSSLRRPAIPVMTGEGLIARNREQQGQCLDVTSSKPRWALPRPA
ncbi:MAG: hypothetical protein WKF73_17660 [Nocardioidaceae bacterium]